MANRRSYVDLLITYGFLIMGIDPIAGNAVRRPKTSNDCWE